MEIKRYKASQVLLVSNQQKPKTVVYTISGLSNVRTFHHAADPHPLQCDKKVKQKPAPTVSFSLVASVKCRDCADEKHFISLFYFFCLHSRYLAGCLSPCLCRYAQAV